MINVCLKTTVTVTGNILPRRHCLQVLFSLTIAGTGAWVEAALAGPEFKTHLCRQMESAGLAGVTPGDMVVSHQVENSKGGNNRVASVCMGAWVRTAPALNGVPPACEGLKDAKLIKTITIEANSINNNLTYNSNNTNQVCAIHIN